MTRCSLVFLYFKITDDPETYVLGVLFYKYFINLV